MKPFSDGYIERLANAPKDDAKPFGFPKDAVGTFTRERRKKHAEAKINERTEKLKARKRDHAACHGYCRWPGCRCRLSIEVAHLEHKGSGGDVRTIRSTVEKLICVCQMDHRGPHGIDTGDREVRPMTPLGTNGPCAFWIAVQDGEQRVMRPFAYETSIGVYRYDVEHL